MYFKTRLKSTEAAVHLSGYLLDEPTDCQWEDEFTDDFEEEEEGETTYLPEVSIDKLYKVYLIFILLFL